MTIEELIEKLKAIRELQLTKDRKNGWTNEEFDHENADELLLQFIGNDKVREAFDSINKYYS